MVDDRHMHGEEFEYAVGIWAPDRMYGAGAIGWGVYRSNCASRNVMSLRAENQHDLHE